MSFGWLSKTWILAFFGVLFVLSTPFDILISIHHICIYGANSDSHISVCQLHAYDVSLVQAIQLTNRIHFPSSLNTRKNLNLHRMKQTMDFRPGGHGQRGDNFTVSVDTKPFTGNWWSNCSCLWKIHLDSVLIWLLQSIVTYILFSSKFQLNVQRCHKTVTLPDYCHSSLASYG